jgi:hypothetical protein
MDILQIAIAKGTNIDQMERLMAMQERWEATQATKAFNAAMARFKANPPQIRKNKDVSFGTTKYSHATLDHVTEQITQALSAVGISHTWAVEQGEKEIAVSCILTHEMGHSERTTLRALPDTSGSKNSIQAIGSAVTYLQRYTLLAATGMAAGVDDDGATSGPQMPPDDLAYHREQIEAATNMTDLQKVFAAAYKAAKASGDENAQKSLTKLYEEKKRERR